MIEDDGWVDAKRRKKAKKVSKPFIIEWKTKDALLGKDWMKWKAYDTEEKRDQAFKAITNGSSQWFEFRKVEK